VAYNLNDRTREATFGPEDVNAFFIDETMLVVNGSTVTRWAPAGGYSPMPNATPWSYLAGPSPDSLFIAYTAYADDAMTQPRVYVYDWAAAKPRMLLDQPRSQAVFVKDRWVWYFEEQPCGNCPGSTKSSGKVLAMDVTVGSEQPVVFAAGEAPTDLAPGEFWPHA
jgi:hypothetical protein